MLCLVQSILEACESSTKIRQVQNYIGLITLHADTAWKLDLTLVESIKSHSLMRVFSESYCTAVVANPSKRIVWGRLHMKSQDWTPAKLIPLKCFLQKCLGLLTTRAAHTCLLPALCGRNHPQPAGRMDHEGAFCKCHPLRCSYFILNILSPG